MKNMANDICDLLKEKNRQLFFDKLGENFPLRFPLDKFTVTAVGDGKVFILDPYSENENCCFEPKCIAFDGDREGIIIKDIFSLKKFEEWIKSKYITQESARASIDTTKLSVMSRERPRFSIESPELSVPQFVVNYSTNEFLINMYYDVLYNSDILHMLGFTEMKYPFDSLFLDTGKSLEKIDIQIYTKHPPDTAPLIKLIHYDNKYNNNQTYCDKICVPSRDMLTDVNPAYPPLNIQIGDCHTLKNKKLDKTSIYVVLNFYDSTVPLLHLQIKPPFYIKTNYAGIFQTYYYRGSDIICVSPDFEDEELWKKMVRAHLDEEEVDEYLSEYF